MHYQYNLCILCGCIRFRGAIRPCPETIAMPEAVSDREDSGGAFWDFPIDIFVCIIVLQCFDAHHPPDQSTKTERPLSAGEGAFCFKIKRGCLFSHKLFDFCGKGGYDLEQVIDHAIIAFGENRRF
jgi:hypothetical protein